jgi:hypothetical protein
LNVLPCYIVAFEKGIDISKWDPNAEFRGGLTLVVTVWTCKVNRHRRCPTISSRSLSIHRMTASNKLVSFNLTSANLYTSNHFPRRLMWTQDWLRRIRSGRILSVEPTGRNDATIAGQKSTLEDADLTIVTHDDEDNDFVVVYADACGLPSNSFDASHIKTASPGTPFRSDPQQLVGDCEETYISRASAQKMELCGRGDHNHTFQDLRSASQAGKREKTTCQKYYNFKHVKPGDVRPSHSHPSDPCDDNQETLSERDHNVMTKAELYRQAQLPPRPPKYHRRHIDKIYGTLSHRVDARREARKHEKAILRDHLRNL